MLFLLLSLTIAILILFLPIHIEVNVQKNDKEIMFHIKFIIIKGVLQIKLNTLSISVLKKNKLYIFIRNKIEKAAKYEDILEEDKITSINDIYRSLQKGYEIVHIVKAIINYLVKQIEICSLIWITKIGTEDAAITSIITGLIWAIKNMILASILYGKKVDAIKLSVVPEFEHQGLEIYFDCIIRFKLVYIIIAGFIGLKAKLKGGESNVGASN